MKLQGKLIMLGALLGGLSVALGAFGAHAFKQILLENGRTVTYELASKYQFYHALALLVMAALADTLNPGKLYWAALLMTLGMVVFSGSLYVLSLSNITIYSKPINQNSMKEILSVLQLHRKLLLLRRS